MLARMSHESAKTNSAHERSETQIFGFLFLIAASVQIFHEGTIIPRMLAIVREALQYFA